MGRQENLVEVHLKKEVVKLQGTTRKYRGQPGVADQLCFLPGGHLFLVEVKTSSGKESPEQARERKRMTELGFRARVAYGIQSVDDIINEMKQVLNADTK